MLHHHMWRTVRMAAPCLLRRAPAHASSKVACHPRPAADGTADGLCTHLSSPTWGGRASWPRSVHAAATAEGGAGEPAPAGSSEDAAGKPQAKRRRVPRAAGAAAAGAKAAASEAKASQREGGSGRRQPRGRKAAAGGAANPAASAAAAVDAEQGPAAAAAAAAGASGPRMLILDASAILYRAHHASLHSYAGNRLMTSSGEDTTVLYRFFNSLFAILAAQPSPTHFVVVNDSGGTTFRHAMDSGYKGRRESCPKEVSLAANRLRALLPQMGIHVVKEAGWEADDLIASLAVRGVEEGLHVTVVSPDKDFLQLLRPGLDLLRIKVATQGKAKYSEPCYTHLDFEQEYGIPPPQYAEFQALVGDAVDDIPGLKGIGPVTALRLLREHGSLAGVLAAAEQVKPKKAQEALTAPGATEQVMTNLKLATLRTNMDLPEPECWRLRGVREEDAAAALREFEYLEFKSLMGPLRAHLEWLHGLSEGGAAGSEAAAGSGVA